MHRRTLPCNRVPPLDYSSMPHATSTARRRPKPSRPPNATRRHPIRAPEAQRLWWGHASGRDRKHSIPSIVDYATAIATIRTHADNPDAAWWLDETRERLGAALSSVRSWRHADNAMRDAFLRGLPAAPLDLAPPESPSPTRSSPPMPSYFWTTKPASAPRTPPTRTCAAATFPRTARGTCPGRSRIAIANIPRSAVAVAGRLGSPHRTLVSP